MTISASDGWCYDYYGAYDPTIKPKRNLQYFMLDEYIKSSVDKEKDMFRKEITQIISEFKKLLLSLLKDLDDEKKAAAIKIKLNRSKNKPKDEDDAQDELS